MAVTLVFPQRFKIPLLRLLAGWSIGSHAYVGFSYINADEVRIGEGVYIGHFNLVRNMKSFRVGPRSHIKNFNSFFGAATIAEHGFNSVMELGSGVLFMSHHFVDCAGTLQVEDNVTIGGRSTEIYTHQRNIKGGVPFLEPTTVHIGQNAYVAARCTLVSCIIPPDAVVGAGAVVVGDHQADGTDGPVLLAGNPATVRKRYQPRLNST
ncbi:MAG: hypothetical protein M3256_04645 [Actinomycetota bacterium]|nr:hypothetical protein [Actinomycetota bacterium]